MDWFSDPDYWLSRLCFQRALALVYLFAFVAAARQGPALIGERGLTPAPRFLRSIGFRRSPSLFHVRYSDGLLAAVSWTGALAAAGAAAGVSERGPLWLSMAWWALLWVLYLSIVNVGQVWYGFGWESLLLEAGFLAVFLGPEDVAPPTLVLWLLRWLLFRLEFGAGLIKLRGDPCWRDLTCLAYHHETQPMPNPLSWYFHRLPAGLHKMEVLGNHFAQLVVPFLLFAPQPVATGAALVIIVTQSWLVLSGNFSWLNAVTIALALSVVDGSLLLDLLPLSPPAAGALPPSPGWHEGAVWALTALVAVLSYWPARNMISPGQLMNFSFNRLHLVNTYGAFGRVTRVRNEVIVEGTTDSELTPESEWKEYEFKGKPGDLRRRPRQVAPYHLRLDWLMWFAALSPRYADPWLAPFVQKLLQNDRAVLKLLRTNPFPDEPPVYVRARLYRYRFTTRAERRDTGAWWHRTLAGEYLRPMTLASLESVRFPN